MERYPTSTGRRTMKANVNVLTTAKYTQCLAQLLMFMAIVFLITNCIQMRTLNLDTTMRSLVRNEDNGMSPGVSHTSIETVVEGSTFTHDESVGVESKSQQAYYYSEIPKRKPFIQKDFVRAGDYIYYQDENWDTSPIVIESHKLLFFTIPKVGCTIWKQLFRRMMNYSDWTSQDYDTHQPHNPEINGLKYLYSYTLEEASIMMTSPDWTRAMMVRDPKLTCTANSATTIRQQSHLIDTLYYKMPVILEHQALVDIAVGVGILSASFMIASGLLCLSAVEKSFVNSNDSKKIRLN